jgi:GNAT superfamily N-acetyltransferase
MSDQDQRTPPERIRVKKLQEAHLPKLLALEEAAAAIYTAEFGVDNDARTVLSERDFARLTRTHDVCVVEADHQVAGYLAWIDQAPGVAFIERLVVAEDYQRFGVATVLLRAVGEKAAQHGIPHAAVMCFNRNIPALSFLAVRGFVPIDLGAPAAIESWCQQHLQAHPPAPTAVRSCWWATAEGLGLVPGLPTP